jgi:hypothetical protein
MAVTSEWPRYVVGNPEQVAERLTRMAEALRVDELMAITVVHHHAARLRSYELLAQAFGLEPRGRQRDSVGLPQLENGRNAAHPASRRIGTCLLRYEIGEVIEGTPLRLLYRPET